jgi:tetratricopeptide (TPR) repeat protein
MTPADGFLLSRVDASADEQDVEIDPARRLRIDDLHARLDQLTHYALLGVDETADTKQVKAAFHAIVAELHPDRFFRRRLGTYQQKLEAIFARANLARDVLVSARRAVYDKQLARLRGDRATGARPAAPPSLPAHTSEPGLPAVRSPADDLRPRRRALAGKPSGPCTKLTPARAEPAVDPEYARRTAEALHAHLAARGIEQAESALDRGYLEDAIAVFRVAAALVPVAETCDDGIRRAQRTLADIYWEQAQQAEHQARWEEAARCWAEVCAERPGDAAAHERAANVSLRTGDVRRAVEMARKAVELEPSSALYRIALARTYGAARLEASFHGELDRALDLAPGDPRVQGMVARLRSLAWEAGTAS